jgi:hypothetical protein
LVLVILFSFALGMAIGVLGMLPHWWRQRHKNSPLTNSGLEAPSNFGLPIDGSNPTLRSSGNVDYGP